MSMNVKTTKILKRLGIIFAAASLLCLWRSISMHIDILLSYPIITKESLDIFHWLQRGILLFVFPLFLSCYKIMWNFREKDIWKLVYHLCPFWVTAVLNGMFIIGFIDGLYCQFILLYVKSSSDTWDYWRIRSLSDINILFYSAAIMIFYAFYLSFRRASR